MECIILSSVNNKAIIVEVWSRLIDSSDAHSPTQPTSSNENIRNGHYKLPCDKTPALCDGHWTIYSVAFFSLYYLITSPKVYFNYMPAIFIIGKSRKQLIHVQLYRHWNGSGTSLRLGPSEIQEDLQGNWKSREWYRNVNFTWTWILHSQSGNQYGSCGEKITPQSYNIVVIKLHSSKAAGIITYLSMRDLTV